MTKANNEAGAVARYLKSIGSDFRTGNATKHTYRPALKELIESFRTGIKATNEPKREKCGAPDFIITHGQTPLGYIEAKDIGKSLDAIESDSGRVKPKIRDGEQLKRYRQGLGNLILTDYLEFRWFEGGKHRLTARIASVTADRKLREDKSGIEQFFDLMNEFLVTRVSTVSDPKELAKRMAGLAKILKSTIIEAFGDEDKGGSLHSQLEGFREVLLHDLKPDQFADMYAQTICYGLFSAKCNHPESKSFRRKDAVYALPKTNPFLIEMFDYIAGRRLDERLVWAVDHLVELLNRADLHAILKDFGQRTRREDPVVHFYETFLAAYDPKMRKARGVYYTPEPVVSYIVRSIDHILKTDFGIEDGLADTSKIPVYKTEKNKNGKPLRKKVGECHKVLILDPAVGTGTFLHGVIDHIHEHLVSKGQKGTWSSYVSEHLLPRLFGFELLMAPYAVAHMKLGLQLKELGYDFKSGERLRVYLTNTLEKARDKQIGVPFADIIAEEANQAVEIKSEAPVMVILGNPPYSGHSANKGEWISRLLRGKDTMTGESTANYFEVDGKPLGERNPKWLNDDYVKFIRFAQWRIEKTGYGILAFISNHSYLDNPTFRGMRQSLLTTFDRIHVLDLHGNTKKKEICPDGSKDENVFDIQQGVAVGIFVTGEDRKKSIKVNYGSMWGLREQKYGQLVSENVQNTDWLTLSPSHPHYLFIPQDENLRPEYDRCWLITNVFSLSGSTMTTARNRFSIAYEPETLMHRASDLVSESINDDWLRSEYGLRDVSYWKLSSARDELREADDIENFIKPLCYRPFDFRYVLYHKAVCERLRQDVLGHMVPGNLALLTHRPQSPRDFTFAYCTRMIGDQCVAANKSAGGGNSFQFPLYRCLAHKKHDLFDGDSSTNAQGARRSNLSAEFMEDCAKGLRMTFIPDGKGDLKKTFGPEDVFDYIYAVLHSPTYRSRYAEFLKIDFPRIPLTSKERLFRNLCALGEELVGLHLMEKHGPNLTAYPVDGDHLVEKIRYSEPGAKNPLGRVWINKEQFFEGVAPEVWEFHIGGYQVCQKWLKDRKRRNLSCDDLDHYQHIVSALSETIRLMAEIDEAIENQGGWPIN